jgi:hypothetical protein
MNVVFPSLAEVLELHSVSLERHGGADYSIGGSTVWRPSVGPEGGVRRPAPNRRPSVGPGARSNQLAFGD